MRLSLAKILLIKLIFLTALSCSPKNPNESMNSKFRSSYGGQVNKILSNKRIKERDFQTVSTRKTRFNSNPDFKLYATPSQIFSNDAPTAQPTSFETHKLFLKRSEINSPTSQTYRMGKKGSASSKIPSDIFDIKYNTARHPPFQITGIDFDIIVIPNEDAYGVSSSLNEKSYPITGTNYIARNINSIISNRSDEDVEFSEELIQEQKLIKKQIAVAKLYKSDNTKEAVNKDSYDYDNTKEKWAIERRKIRNEPISKIIALW